MTLPAFKKLNPVGDYQLQTVENNVAQAFARVLPVLLLDHVVVAASFTAPSVPLAIPHRLGRKPQGWFLVDIDAAATVFRSAWSSTLLTLTASAPCSALLWVY